jgi:hypothetical protein
MLDCRRAGVLTFAVGLLSLACAAGVVDTARLDPEERRIVALAEAFVRDNGYTNQPGRPSEKLQGESLEFLRREEWPEQRRGTLESSAYGFKRFREGVHGWFVLFCHDPTRRSSTGGSDRPSGRAVRVNPAGTRAAMMHQDFYLDAVDVRLRTCSE